MKQFIQQILKQIFFPKCVIYDKILSIEFNEIDLPLINCFNSDDLSFATKTKVHYHKNKNNIQNFLNNLFTSKEITSEIELKKINSVRCSKSNVSGYSFDSLYLFGRDIYVYGKSKWSFDECITHVFDRHDEKLNITYCQWNDKFSWNNIDGSHHFAVAIFHDYNEKIDYKIKSDLTIQSINKEVALELLKYYEMFVINSDNAYSLKKYFSDDDFVSCNISHENNMLILISKTKSNIKPYIDLLKKIDKKNILNFNDYLELSLNNQENKYQRFTIY